MSLLYDVDISFLQISLRSLGDEVGRWLLQGGLAPAPLHPPTPGATGSGVLPVVCRLRRQEIAAND